MKTSIRSCRVSTALLLAAVVTLIGGCAAITGNNSSGKSGKDAVPNRLQAAASQTEVLTGLDVLVQENFARLNGKKVALIGNHSSINREGEHIIDLLQASENADLVALFSPEHGFTGVADHKVGNEVDESTGLPIYSLYDDTRAPTLEELEGVDVLIFDIQDIGARFYTYIATMGQAMMVAEEAGIEFMVLDRPNPIQGTWFDGPIQDDDLMEKFTAFVPMPIAHGMTVGEMAKLYERYYDITPSLEIVKMKNWKRDMYYDETGLPWTNPSPNMRSVDEELLYTMVALTEANKAVSVGRGTDRPFEYVGATWMDERLADDLNSRNLPGLWFMNTTFIPSDIDITGRKNYPYPYVGEVANGVRIVVVNRHVVSPVESGIHLLDAMLRLYPEEYTIERLRGLVGAQWVLDAIEEGRDPAEIVQQWRDSDEFKEFAEQRRSVLLY